MPFSIGKRRRNKAARVEDSTSQNEATSFTDFRDSAAADDELVGTNLSTLLSFYP